MFLETVAAIALSILGFFLSLQGLWLTCRALWPSRVRRTAEQCRSHHVTSLLLGIPMTVAVLAVAGLVGRRGGTPGQIAAWILGGTFLIYAGTGMSGLVTFIGERLPSPADTQRPWWTTVRGGAAVELAVLFPVVGWFVLLPLAVMLGVGAITASFLGRSGGSDLRSALAANRDFALTNRTTELSVPERQEGCV